jgi:hypothetical protein
VADLAIGILNGVGDAARAAEDRLGDAFAK